MAGSLHKGLAVAALAAVFAVGAAAPAQAKAAAAHKAAPAAAHLGQIPRAADGHPDFSGIWQTLSEAEFDLEPHAGRRDAPPGAGVIEGGHIPYLPEALAKRQANFAHRTSEDPRFKGWLQGVPRGVYSRQPFEIFQRPAGLTLVHQYGFQVRDIHTDGSKHPDYDYGDLWQGDSRGHWEGDTLVVDINGFNEDLWLDRSGNYHSEKLHVVERWKFIDANTLSYSATLDDPKVYARPWTLSVQLNRREPGYKLIEDYAYTLEYADHYPHKDGQQ